MLDFIISSSTLYSVQPESAEEEVRTNEEVRGEKEVRQGEDRAEEEDRVEEDISKQEDTYVEELRIDEVQPEHALTREQERSEMSFDDKMPSPVFRRFRRNPKPKVIKSLFGYLSSHTCLSIVYFQLMIHVKNNLKYCMQFNIN